MNIYQRELQKLRPDDEIQNIIRIKGYDKILTASHGFLVVPRSDPWAKLAKRICEYGCVGKYAIYLEEDVEQSEFLSAINDRPEFGKQYRLTGRRDEKAIFNGDRWSESEVKD